MKILYVLHQFFPHHHTGTERLTLQLAKQMQLMGNFVTVLTYEPNKSVTEGFEELDKNLLQKKYTVETIPVISLKSKKQRLGTYIFDDLIEKHLNSIIKEFDIVHFTHPMRFGSVLKSCKELKIPTILTLTDNWLLCPQGLVTANKQLCNGPDKGNNCMDLCNYDKTILDRYNNAKFFFENIDVIYTGSEFVIQTFKNNVWDREINLNTFSMDYSYVKAKKQNSSLVIGFIGSLIWHKGAHILVDAFKKVNNPKIKLVIYGKGAEGDPYPNEIFKMIKDDKRISYEGTFEYKELPDVLNKISIMTIPSVYKEIYPLVMQASFAYKIPIIGSKIGGLPEMIKDEENGLLFEVGNVEELTKIISKIGDDPSLVEKLSQNISPPPRVEEEAFEYEKAYRNMLNKN